MYQWDVCKHAEADIPVTMQSFLFHPISILCVRSAHHPLLSPPLLPSKLSHSAISCFLSGTVSSTEMHPCALTQWPRMASMLHLTLGNLLTTDFCFSFPLFFCFCWPLSPLLLSSFSNSPSFSVWVLFLFFFSMKWPYQVPRYVSDAAPHVPTLRFGKEMSAKSRLQGRPSHSSTFYPVLHNLSSTGTNSSQCLFSAVLPYFLTFFASTKLFLFKTLLLDHMIFQAELLV